MPKGLSLLVPNPGNKEQNDFWKFEFIHKYNKNVGSSSCSVFEVQKWGFVSYRTFVAIIFGSTFAWETINLFYLHLKPIKSQVNKTEKQIKNSKKIKKSN